MEDTGVDKEDNIKMDFEGWDGRAEIGSIWLMIGTGGGLLQMRGKPLVSTKCG